MIHKRYIVQGYWQVVVVSSLLSGIWCDSKEYELTYYY